MLRLLPARRTLSTTGLPNSNSRITVINVTPKTVTIDSNSPLVGQNLTFTIKLVNVTRVQNQ